MRGIPYTEAIGSVLWPVVISRLDAAFAVSTLSQFIQNPRPAHWEALKHVIVFLGSTKDLCLHLAGDPNLPRKVFAMRTGEDKNTITLFLVIHFTWEPEPSHGAQKKQHVVALSSTEAEYIVQMHAAKEALWLRSFLRELRSAPDDPLILNCDNQGAITLAKDNKFHLRTKHIDVRYHFIREAVEDGKVAVQYIPTGDNVSDIFTKPLAKAKFQELAELLGLRAIMRKV